MSQRIVVGSLLAGVTLVILGLACAEQERLRILTLLFDGVPEEEPGQQTPGEAPDSERGRQIAEAPAPTRTLLDPSSPKAHTVSLNHASFATNCDRCHSPNATVTDDHCQACHTERAHEAGIEMPASCGSCHPEHQGRSADLTRPASDRCTECHDAGPFEEEHAEFALIDDPDAAREAKYATGLEIFHTIHAGAPLPDGDREGEDCRCMDCHFLHPTQPDTFEPPTYDTVCHRCHELEVHKSVPSTSWPELRAELPTEADPAPVLLTDARWREWKRQAGDTPAVTAMQQARDALIDDGLEECFRCHSFADREVDGERYAVVPPTRYRRQWFSRVRFKHSAHAFLDCRECHVAPSKVPDELGYLMLPDQEKCASCHREGGASNACSTCHTFHTRTPWFKSDLERQKLVTGLLNLQPGS
jgi:predicted CXXCH cytochrome family protein